MEITLEEQEYFRNFLRRDMIRRGLDQQEYAKFLGISKGFLSLIFSEGRSGSRSLHRFASKIGVSIDHLLGRVIMIPIVAGVSAGESFKYAIDRSANDYIEITDLPGFDKRNPDKYYAVRIRGDSMVPIFKNWDIVIAEKDSFINVKNGDKVVSRDNDGNAWIKYVEIAKDVIILRALNPAFPPIILPEENITLLDKVRYSIYS